MWSQGMTALVQNIKNLGLPVIARAFTYYSRSNYDSVPPLTPPRRLHDLDLTHLEAEQWLSAQSPRLNTQDKLIIVGHSYGGHRAKLFADQVLTAFPGVVPDTLVLADAINWRLCGHYFDCRQANNPQVPPTAVSNVLVYRQTNDAAPQGYLLRGYEKQAVLLPPPTTHGSADDSHIVQRGIINLLQPGLVPRYGSLLPAERPWQLTRTSSFDPVILNVTLRNGGQLLATSIHVRAASFEDSLGHVIAATDIRPDLSDRVLRPGESAQVSLTFPPLPWGVKGTLRVEAVLNGQLFRPSIRDVQVW
jgi:hypothetical protein